MTVSVLYSVHCHTYFAPNDALTLHHASVSMLTGFHDATCASVGTYPAAWQCCGEGCVAGCAQIVCRFHPSIAAISRSCHANCAADGTATGPSGGEGPGAGPGGGEGGGKGEGGDGDGGDGGGAGCELAAAAAAAEVKTCLERCPPPCCAPLPRFLPPSTEGANRRTTKSRRVRRSLMVERRVASTV